MLKQLHHNSIDNGCNVLTPCNFFQANLNKFVVICSVAFDPLLTGWNLYCNHDFECKIYLVSIILF